ncbi:PdcA protein, partial [Escherichia coli]
MVLRSRLMARKYNKLSREALKMLLDGVSRR